MTILKHLVGTLSHPMVFALMMALAASIVRARGHGRTALALIAAAAAVIFLAAEPPVAEALLRPLERQYVPLLDDRSLPQVRYVVVLGSDYEPRADASVTGTLDEDGLDRIVEGIRLLRLLPGARLLVSGGASPPHAPPAIGYARLARSLGIDDTELELLTEPLDTAAEARNVAKRIGSASFLLVTSAYHMPRAMTLMRRAGAHPIPAPVGQRVGRWRQSFVPQTGALGSTDRAIHEYLGLAGIVAELD